MTASCCLQETDITVQCPPQSKQQTIVVTPVAACLLPTSDCGFTCALIAENTHLVITEHRWTANSSVCVCVCTFVPICVCVHVCVWDCVCVCALLCKNIATVCMCVRAHACMSGCVCLYSILGCVLPLQEVALHQSPPSFSILVHTAPCCPTMSSLQRCFGLSTDLTPFICHSVLLIVHLLSFIRAMCLVHFHFVLVMNWTMSVTLVLCLMMVLWILSFSLTLSIFPSMACFKFLY